MQYKVITAELHTRTALHIGSGSGNETSDALIRRDAAGVPVIPGTALAGVLRSLLTRLAPRLYGSVCKALEGEDGTCNCAVCQLMGTLNPSDEGENSAQASRLLVFNATLKENGKGTLIRDGVGINRETGAAARAGRVKFDLETLPAGVIFDLRLELRGKIEENEPLLAAGLAEWKAGRAWVGGRVNRGMGAFELKNLAFKTLDLDPAENLVNFLGEDEPWKKLAKLSGESTWPNDLLKDVSVQSASKNENTSLHFAQTWVKITGTLTANGLLLTNDTTNSGLTGFDHAPLLGKINDWQRPLLSGAGLRGVIRSHAERIARTVTTLANEHDRGTDKAATWFNKHCPACDPNVRRTEKNPNPALESCDSLLKANGVSNNEEVKESQLCLACRLFGSTRRGSRLVVEDAPYNATFAGGKPKPKMLDFVAIDRFTGGAAEKFKFDALALWKPAFSLNIFLENPRPWELGWLALVLRDMEEGWLRVGMGASKGFGQVELIDLKMKMGYLHLDDLKGFELDTKGQRESSIYTELLISLQDAEPWITAFNNIIEGNEDIDAFERGDGKKQLPLFLKDTYYNGSIDRLYPCEVMV